MLGKNKCLKIDHVSYDSLQVHSIFLTLQGEGPYTGKPAVFIRLSGCNLACSFCDTEFDSYDTMEVAEIVTRVKSMRDGANLVVITGGEPLRQNLTLLCDLLHEAKMLVQIETNGTIPYNIPKVSQLVCSPKNTCGQYKIISGVILRNTVAIKFLISEDMHGYQKIAEVGQTEYKTPVYVQPMDQYDSKKNLRNVHLAMQLAKKYNATLSLQTHKILQIK